ncbi:MAG: hypothetical protein IPM35_32695 [Myxococcales bacterium]|nr:hypothetical protein [Myxococcales bacterium]
MRARRLLWALCAWSSHALADAGTGAPERVTATCIERWPEGKPRPKLEERFPEKGTSGWAATLEVVVEHGKGETVLPNGFRIELESDAARALERAGFAIPDADGGAGPSIQVTPSGDTAKSTVKVPVVALPPKPGRSVLELPPLPIAIARASGEVVTLCTAPHSIVIDDPIASTPDAQPKDNPPPRPEREVWTAAKQVTLAALVALLVGALVAWLIGRWRARPKPVPPPPPPRPPWEVAFEELGDLRARELIKNERYAEHYARVSHIVRKYCGDRYGFDGLESTTREMMSVLRRVVPPIVVLPEIEASLRHADLVKFARLTPSAEECEEALARAEQIVRRTVPLITEPPLPPPGAAPPPPPAAQPGQGAEAP